MHGRLWEFLSGLMNSAFSTLLKVCYWTYVIDPNPHLITYLIFKVHYKITYLINSTASYLGLILSKYFNLFIVKLLCS